MEKVRGFAVIDLETTGFSTRDRVVEIAIVLLDVASLKVIDEFDTLVNPNRDLGATHVHGITASMASAAPAFEEIAPHVAALLDQTVLVAHNLAFDQRMLLQEFDRLQLPVQPGSGLCTLNWTRQKLSTACTALGVEIDGAHRALADARATAELFSALVGAGKPVVAQPMTAAVHADPSVPRTYRREHALGTPDSRLFQPSFRTAYPGSNDAELSYLNMLDRFVSDAEFTDDERSELARIAATGGFTSRVPELHQSYFDAALTAAMRDEILSTRERSYLEFLARALGVTWSLETESIAISHGSALSPGARVCFTGAAIVDGSLIERDQLHAIALSNALLPVHSVTKRNCDLLVAADVASMSGKAKKARDYGIPMMDVAEFLKQVNLGR